MEALKLTEERSPWLTSRPGLILGLDVLAEDGRRSFAAGR
jgi:hypothetical protein